MKITICKYNYDLRWDKLIPNYFSSHCSWYDTIVLQGISSSGFPLYEESGEAADEFYTFQAEAYSVSASLLHSELSFRGVLIKDFLIPDINRNFLAVCEVDLGTKKIYGKVDLSSIKCNLNPIRIYNISFTIISLEAELMNHLQSIEMLPFGNYVPNKTEEYRFQNYMTNRVFGGIATHFTSVDMDELSLGVFLYISNPLQIKLHTNNTITQYDNFIAFAKWMGFVYKLEFVSEVFTTIPIGWNFKLKLTRPTIITTRTEKEIVVLEDNFIKGLRPLNKEYVFIPTGKFLGDYQYSYSQGIKGTAYYGMLRDKVSVNKYDTTGGLTSSNHIQPFLLDNEKFIQYSQNDTYFQTSKEYINIMDVTFYEQDLLKGQKWVYNPLTSTWIQVTGMDLEITLGRMLVSDWSYSVTPPPFPVETYSDEGVINALGVYAGTEYGRLVKGYSTMVECSAIYEPSESLKRFDKVSLNVLGVQDDFYVNAINDLDIINNTQKLELQEIL